MRRGSPLLESELVRLVERRPGVGITAARPYEPNRRERRDPRPNRRTRRADDLVRPFDRLVPAALLECASREPAEDVVAVELEPVIAVEGQPGPQAAIGRVVTALPERPAHNLLLDRPGELDQAVLERRLERDLRPLRTGENPELDVARRRRNLQHPPAPQPGLVGPRTLVGEKRHLIVGGAELAARPVRLQQRDRVQPAARDSST